ncbi:substrate-binding domain-containing protein [Granulicella sp. 5B5]|uniref:LacI family DNA-binding transcriptional regulator n=1 Tax=Granulicella sp. 5B5 TaxID=1617967 RepID=UPI0015F6C50F|nr:LacI family DNA-binding transcriptional regulator [Granulicella sp. 5B5]QMV18884.1 substrate-binding domain-containing protein [Granulicella sp. 5B5]
MNIKAVAKRANVSTATVSRTINGSAKVSPRTAERVLKSIEELNFYPDTNARALGSGRSNLFGLIISDITNPFFPELVKSFEDFAVANGQEVLIANTNYDPERMKLCVRRMLQRKVDGVAVITSEMDEGLVADFSRRHIPLVFLDSADPGPGVSCVRIDYAAGIDAAVDHLIKLGHRRIAFISGPMRLASARVRYKAFMESTARDHLDHNPHLIEEGNHRVDGGHEAMRRILHSGAKPTAVLASNDLTAIGAMGAITEAGLRVPDDISVVGFDDIQLSAFTMPPLSTVRLPRSEIAKYAFNALLSAMQADIPKPVPGKEYLVLPSFVARKSTGPVRKKK